MSVKVPACGRGQDDDIASPMVLPVSDQQLSTTSVSRLLSATTTPDTMPKPAEEERSTAVLQENKVQPPTYTRPEFNFTTEDEKLIEEMVQQSLERLGKSRPTKQENASTCALNFYGLPRSFRSMALPSIIENVLIPNAGSQCHVFVSYHNRPYENKTSFAGEGGPIVPRDVLLLDLTIRQVNRRLVGSIVQPVVVRFVEFTDEDIWKEHGAFWNEVRTARDGKFNRSLYQPLKGTKYTAEEMDNIVRMWHGQQSVWRLMEHASEELQVNYTRVAMMRLDAFYATPIRVATPDDHMLRIQATGGASDHVTIPKFMNAPFAGMVNDRFIMGPYHAVKPWATQQIELMKSHLKFDKRKKFHKRMNVAFFMRYTMLPAIERQGVAVVEDSELCFWRLRAQEQIWLQDCGPKRQKPRIKADYVQRIVQRRCVRLPGPNKRRTLAYDNAIYECPLKGAIAAPEPEPEEEDTPKQTKKLKVRYRRRTQPLEKVADEIMNRRKSQ